MKKKVLWACLVGTVLSFPLLYALEPDSLDAVSFVIGLCIVIVFTLMSLFGAGRRPMKPAGTKP